MSALSLLEGCKNILEKSHETWKSYFSRWESLVEMEEDIPDDSFISMENTSKKKLNKKTALLKSKKILKKKITKRNKNKTTKEVIERSKDSGNENLPEEVDNKQLEMHLRTIFLDILKANKNKWEVFAVLSQTFSHRDLGIKFPHSLHPNHQPTLPSCNDIEHSGANILFKKVGVFSPRTRYASLLNNEIRPDKIEHFGSSFTVANIEKKETLNCIVPQSQNNVLNFCSDNKRENFLEGTFTPPSSKRIIFDFKSCPPVFPNFSRHTKTKLKPAALVLHQETTPKNCRKVKKFFARNIPEMSITREEKGLESLCLHKGTNSFNMKNSNFTIPERNPSKRKCFSENISQRKRGRPAKLFFDFWESSDSENEEQTENSTPRIGWHSKTRKSCVSQEVITVKSDSDESDSIL